MEPDYGIRTACAWLHDKFGVEIAPEEARDLEPAKFTELAHQRAIAAYDQRESEYPVLAGLYRFSARGAGGQRQGFLREDLVEWAKRRFDAELSVDDLKNKQREEIRELLVAHSQKNNEKAKQVAAEAQQRVEQLFADEPTVRLPRSVPSPARTASSMTSPPGSKPRATPKSRATSWLDSIAKRPAAKCRKSSKTISAPKCGGWSGHCSLQILDSAWKEHLLAMDHLKSSVGLRGYAQIDPKVEYKREGMPLFDSMWISIGNYVTDLIFKMEQLDEGFVGSTWVEGRPRSRKRPDRPAKSNGNNKPPSPAPKPIRKLEPIRNMGPKVGRNDPCPCGSGKKYKQCCMRKRRRDDIKQRPPARYQPMSTILPKAPSNI